MDFLEVIFIRTSGDEKGCIIATSKSASLFGHRDRQADSQRGIAYRKTRDIGKQGKQREWEGRGGKGGRGGEGSLQADNVLRKVLLDII